MAKNLRQLLGTRDEARQVEMVTALAQPTIVLVITLCPYDGQVTVLAQTDHNGKVAPELVYRMLDMARARVQEIERELRIAQPAGQAPGGAPPAAPATLLDPPGAQKRVAVPNLKPEKNGRH